MVIGIFNALPIGYFDGARILEILLVRIMRPSTATIVKKIIEDHGGDIWATSKEGEGTCIHFILRKYIELQNAQ